MPCSKTTKATHTNYQKFQYFFSDSKWDIQDIKRTRLEIIQKQRTTASTKDGLLAIDDTGCPKPFAKKDRGGKVAILWTTQKRGGLQCRRWRRLRLTNKALPYRHNTVSPCL